MSHQSWLEAPYDQAAREEEAMSRFLDRYEDRIDATIKEHVLGSVSLEPLFQHRISRALKALDPETRIAWAHALDPDIQLFEDWLEVH